MARTEYLRVACPPNGICDGGAVWTDYTPFSLLVAGMLNVPVAIFGTPLYDLLQKETPRSELIILLICVAVLWSYIGWVFDAGMTILRPSSAVRSILGVLGLLFAAFLLVVTATMFHVGVIYKAVTLVWVFVIARHSLRFFRTTPPLNP